VPGLQVVVSGARKPQQRLRQQDCELQEQQQGHAMQMFMVGHLWERATFNLNGRLLIWMRAQASAPASGWVRDRNMP